METKKLIEFKHEFDCSEWECKNLIYSFSIPRLCIKSSAYQEYSINIVDEKVIRYENKQDRYKTTITIRLPIDADVKQWRFVSDTVSIQHCLCEPLWDITKELCKHSLTCDVKKWMISWEALKTTVRQFHQFDSKVANIQKHTKFPLDICEIIANKTIFTQYEWSYFVNEHVLYHLSQALGRGIKGADTLFDKVIREGGLTKDDIMRFIRLHVIKKEPCEDWICVVKHNENKYCIHRKLIEAYNLSLIAIDFFVEYFFVQPVDDMTIYLKYSDRWQCVI
jgi:hypothetical protein